MTAKDTSSYQALTLTLVLPLEPGGALEKSVGGSTSCRFPPNARLSPPFGSATLPDLPYQ
jgi:hypothetical protein